VPRPPALRRHRTSQPTSLAVASTSDPLAPAPPGGAFAHAQGRFVPEVAGIRDVGLQPSGVSFMETLSQLLATGPVKLDGTLAISTDIGYKPIVGTTITIVSSGALTGRSPRSPVTSCPARDGTSATRRKA
jgi:hypothetical protein